MSTMEAVTGLLVNNDYMDIISSNIANASTVGYKSSKPVFFDIFSHSFYANKARGAGVGISHIMQNFNNGMLFETGRDLDIGIVKDGFFRVLDSQGHIHYTRNGEFLLDKDQNIITMQGMYLTGRNKSYSNDNFDNSSDLQPINLQHAQILKEKPTSIIKFSPILNSNINSSNIEDIAADEFSNTEKYATNVTIYDQDGQSEVVSISFKKVNKNTWKVNVKSNDPNENNIDASFDLTFNSNGILTHNANYEIQSKNKKYNNITLNLNNTREQSDADHSWDQPFQDGYSSGSLKTFNILPNGEIIGTYSNQKMQPIGQILLSKFINPEKLQPESGNVWSATEESGAENIGVSGDTGFGTLVEKSLEASNVDLNKELINMIIAQRNYQSNAQSFKAEDKIINTLINLR